MPKIIMQTDGTIKGTTLIIDGTDITKKQPVTHVSMYASAGGIDLDPYISFSYSVREKDKNGISKSISYSLNSDKATIGKDEEPKKQKLIGRDAVEDDGKSVIGEYHGDISFKDDKEKAEWFLTGKVPERSEEK